MINIFVFSMPEYHSLTTSQLIFPSASTSISSTLTDLKRSNLSTTNRLHSIIHDADFVRRVAEAYQLPLIANERCGSWYIPPSHEKAASAYFKSTDGHHGQWSFSLRRLNLQVLDVLAETGGCIVVDSTRRGKRMPDALSKTVPVWVAVLNHLLFPEKPFSHVLQTPEEVVSRSEHAQIEARLPLFVADVQRLALDVYGLRSKLSDKPLEPLWMTPDSPFPTLPPGRKHSHLIILCTASGRVPSTSEATSDYVQGAADDSESWAHGLDAATFWKHHEQLLSTPEDDLPTVIEILVAMSCSQHQMRQPVLIKPTTNVWIGNGATAESLYPGFDTIVCCSEKPSENLATKLKDRYIHLACTRGKVGSRQLRNQLVKLDLCTDMLSPANRILVTCPTGRDLAVGVALAIISLSGGGNCSLTRQYESGSTEQGGPFCKSVIKQRLSWIMVSMPDAAPSRATLQSINAHLLRRDPSPLSKADHIQS